MRRQTLPYVIIGACASMTGKRSRNTRLSAIHPESGRCPGLKRIIKLSGRGIGSTTLDKIEDLATGKIPLGRLAR